MIYVTAMGYTIFAAEMAQNDQVFFTVVVPVSEKNPADKASNFLLQTDWPISKINGLFSNVLWYRSCLASAPAAL